MGKVRRLRQAYFGEILASFCIFKALEGFKRFLEFYPFKIANDVIYKPIPIRR